MITGYTLDRFMQFQKHVSEAGETSLRVEAGTANKEQLMVYVALSAPSGAGRAKLRFDMADPRIQGGESFQMSRLEDNTVVPFALELTIPGRYRIPVPTGINEAKVLVTAELLDADPETDSLEFWVAHNAYQPVSGLPT